MLPEICALGKTVFVDTNISIEILRKIAPLNHTIVMLADPEIPLRRFFDRPDPENSFCINLSWKSRTLKKLWKITEMDCN